jgi:hypothetical protein
MEKPRLPRFRALHDGGKTPTSCLLSISFIVVTALLELFVWRRKKDKDSNP